MELHNILIAFPQKGNNILIAIKKHNIINLFFLAQQKIPMLCSILLLFSMPNSYSFIYLHGRTGWLCCFLQWIASQCLIFKDLLLDWSVLGHEFGWTVAELFSILVMSIRHWASNFILMFISQRTVFSAWGVENRQSVAEPISCLPCLCWYSLWRWRARRHMLSIISRSKSFSISASKSLRIRSSSVEIVFSGTAPC